MLKEEMKCRSISVIDTFKSVLNEIIKREIKFSCGRNIFDFELSEEVFSNEVLIEYGNDLVKQIDGCNCLTQIIIQENLSLLAFLNPNFMVRFIDLALKQLPTKFTVDIILFVHPQSQLIESLYTQRVRFGYMKSIDQYFSELNLDRFSWLKHCDLFSQSTSSGKVTVIPFLPNTIKQKFDKNFVEYFFELCGLSFLTESDFVSDYYNHIMKFEPAFVLPFKNYYHTSCIPELIDLMAYANKTLPNELAREVNFSMSNNFPRSYEKGVNLLRQKDLQKIFDCFEVENKLLIKNNVDWCSENALSVLNSL